MFLRGKSRKQCCHDRGLVTLVSRQSLKVLTGLQDSCTSQIDWSKSLYSLAF